MTATDLLIPATSDQLERLAYSPAETAELLGVARSTVYELLHSGRLPSVLAGNRRLIPRAGIQAFLEGAREKS